MSAGAARYSAIAIILHWVIALSIIFMIGLGVYMGREDVPLSLRFELYQLHKSLGVTILLLSAARLAWRLMNPAPALPNTLKPWERMAAKGTHIAFYGLIFAMPLTGWALVSVSPYNVPTVVWDILPWPHIPGLTGVEDKEAASAAFQQVHKVLAFGTTGLLALHIGAALKHHFVYKDDVLTRMLPFLKPRKGGS